MNTDNVKGMPLAYGQKLKTVRQVAEVTEVTEEIGSSSQCNSL